MKGMEILRFTQNDKEKWIPACAGMIRKKLFIRVPERLGL
jgi:hypothetical protein